MRRNVILVAVLAIGLVGCGNFRELFSAHADVAAEAGGSELSSQRLAQIMSAGADRRCAGRRRRVAGHRLVAVTM